jgi:serine/threonine protein kinase/WD40 repeat protein
LVVKLLSRERLRQEGCSMSDLNLGHPTPKQLIAFGLGRLSEVETAGIRAHLAACPACRALLEGSEAPTPPPPPTVSGTLANPSNGPTPAPIADVSEAPTPPPFPTAASSALDNLPALKDHPRYRVLELLGVGGMGAVFKAEHRLMERVVALKVISRSLVESPTAIQRFRQEVRAAARLAHPNIVTAYDAEQVGDLHFLVMEFVEGTSLAHAIPRKARLPVVYACEFIRQAALGLQHAFELGMVHRDIKPQNLMLTPKNRIKILDFGLARFVSEHSTGAGLTVQGVVMGTPDYIAPEQADDARQADIRADIYSLGCTLYFLLTGQPPFPKGTAMQKILAHLEQEPLAVSVFRDDAPAELLEILHRMMAKRASQRYQTPMEVVRALTPFVRGQPPPPSEGPPPVLRIEPDQPVPVPVTEAKPAEQLAVVPSPKPVTPTKSHPGKSGARKKGFKKRKHFGRRLWRIAGRGWNAGHLAVLLPALGLCLSVGLILLLIWGRRAAPDKSALSPTQPAPRATSSLAKVPVVQDGVVLQGERVHLGGVALATDGGLAVFGDDEGDLYLWDLRATPKPAVLPMMLANKSGGLRKLPRRGKGPLRLLQFSRKGDFLSLSDDRRLTLWNRAGEQTSNLSAENVLTATFSPDGSKVFYIRNDGLLLGWDITDNWHPHRLQVKWHNPQVVAVPPTGTSVAWSSPEGILYLYAGGPATKPVALTAPGTWLKCLAFSPDGTQLAVAKADGDIQLWDVRSRNVAHLCRGHTQVVDALAYAGNGCLLSGSQDRTLRLWNTVSGLELCRLEGHRAAVTGVAITPDSRWAISAGIDRTVRVWHLPAH